MLNNKIHVVPNHSNGWSVKREGSSYASINTKTKAEAIKMGRVISQRSRSALVVHGVDGKIQKTR